MMRFSSLFATATAMMTAGVATAQENLEVIGKPVEGGMGFQPAATNIAEAAQGLDGLINVIIFGITIFVTGCCFGSSCATTAAPIPSPRPSRITRPSKSHGL